MIFYVFILQFIGIIHSMCFLSNCIYWLIFIVPKTALFTLYLFSTHLWNGELTLYQITVIDAEDSIICV